MFDSSSRLYSLSARTTPARLLVPSRLVAYISLEGGLIMFEAITTETFTASTIIGACVLIVAGSGYMLRTKRSKDPIVDVDAAVRDAPYHRLRNILSVADS
ncbi:hypothetical protein ETW23_21185 [Leisingera sp. NJS201]|nr:hypothetical protein ETW23_21185 [Leisingera sp. NJS201]